MIPTEFPAAADFFSQTDADVQRNLLREYEQKLAELPEQQKLTKLCSNAGFSKAIDKGHFCIALDEEGLDDMKTSCRDYDRGTVPISLWDILSRTVNCSTFWSSCATTELSWILLKVF